MNKIYYLLFFIIILFCISSVNAASLNNSLIYYYTMNGTGTEAVESVNRVKNISGLTNVWEPGIKSNAHYIHINLERGVSNINLSQFGVNWSMNFWFNRTSAAAFNNYGRLIDSTFGEDKLVIRYLTSTSAEMNIYMNGSKISMKHNTDLTANVFHMITISRNDSGYTVWLDGNSKGSFDMPNHKFRGSEMCFFNGATNCAAEQPYGNAYMDEVAIWNRTLSANDISALYNSGAGTFFPFLYGVSTVLNTPAEASINPSGNIYFNATLIPLLTNLTNGTFYVWYSNGSLTNITTNTVTGNVTNNTMASINLEEGDYLWNLYGCSVEIEGPGVACSFAASNFSFSVPIFNLTDQYYSHEVYDTDNTTFIVNITLSGSASVYSASLIYNGTNYPYDTIDNLGGGAYRIKKVLDTPAILQNVSQYFYWLFTFNSNVGFSTGNSSVLQQNLSLTNLTSASTVLGLNYTFLDEDTLVPLYSSLDSTMHWYLGGGTTKRNVSTSKPGALSHAFYIVPPYDKLYVNSRLEASNASNANSMYYDRVFDFNRDAITNVSTNITLYLMGLSNGTSVIIEVKDEGLAPMEGVYTKISRFYPGDNTYRVVENRVTDYYGQFTARLIEDTVKYKFEFYDENNTLLKEVSNIQIACTSSICMYSFVLKTSTDQFGRFTNMTGHTHTLTYDNNTYEFEYTWNDQTGKTSAHRLEITRLNLNGTIIVYNESSTNPYGSLSYTVGGQRYSYRAQAYRTINGVETRLDVLNVKVDNNIGIFGLEGLMWGFILMFTLVLFGLWSPAVGVVLYLAGLILLGITGIVFINPAIAIAQIVLGVLFIWAFRS